MRFKNLLGLLAIGGVGAYAYKKRGGDLSLEGIKNSLKGVADKVQSKAQEAKSEMTSGAQADQSASQPSTSRVGYDEDVYAGGSSATFPGVGDSGTNRPPR